MYLHGQYGASGKTTMANHDMFLIELSWQFMTPMEQALWTVTLALNAQDSDAGLAAADAAVLRLRSIAGHAFVTDARRPARR